MEKDLEQIEFTIFDTETTGLEPSSGDRIVELAAIKLKDYKKRLMIQLKNLKNYENLEGIIISAVIQIF